MSVSQGSGITPRSLFLGSGTTIVLDLSAYMHSLEVLREFVVKANNPKLCLLPAHGEVISDALAKIDEYIAIRNKIINKVGDASIYHLKLFFIFNVNPLAPE